MTKLYNLIVLSILLFTSNTVFAWKVGGTYFTSQGAEISVDYALTLSLSNKEIQSLTLTTICLKGQSCNNINTDTLLIDFIEAIKYHRLYTYEAISPGEDCLEQLCVDPFGNAIEQNDSLTSNAPIKTFGVSDNPKRDSFLTKMIDAAIAQVGSSSVLAIKDQLYKNSGDNKTPKYIVVTQSIGGQERPISMCKLKSNSTCAIEKDVIFTNYSSGEIGVSYSKNSFEEEWRELHIANILSRLTEKCTIAYTGTYPNLVAHRVCWFAIE